MQTKARRSGQDPDCPAKPLAPQKERAAEVVQAAYALIAEKGFEGLRTREVAQRTGINSATLHYYFPTKESLIQAVVAHLMQELQTSRAGMAFACSAWDRLRAEFTDVQARLKESPEQLVVLTELAVRAQRDPTVAQLLQSLEEGWRSQLISILQQGMTENEFRPDLDVITTANLMMTQLRGLGYGKKLDAVALDRLIESMVQQTESWVRKHPESKRKSGKTK